MEMLKHCLFENNLDAVLKVNENNSLFPIDTNYNEIKDMYFNITINTTD